MREMKLRKCKGIDVNGLDAQNGIKNNETDNEYVYNVYCDNLCKVNMGRSFFLLFKNKEMET